MAFLNVFHQAKKKQEEAIAYHSMGMLNNINLDQTERIGKALVCHVTADKSSDALRAHSLWHLTMMEGEPLPDCGLYFMEQKCAVIAPGLEKAIAAHPGDYVLCAVTLEFEEGTP